MLTSGDETYSEITVHSAHSPTIYALICALCFQRFQNSINFFESSADLHCFSSFNEITVHSAHSAYEELETRVTSKENLEKQSRTRSEFILKKQSDQGHHYMLFLQTVYKFLP